MKLLRRIDWFLWILVLLIAVRCGADPLDTWIQRSPLPTAADLHSVIHANGLYLAAGDSGTTITSLDGISWTAHLVDPAFPSSPEITGLAYGNGQFLAVGIHGAILTSADGANWTRQWSGINDNLLSVTYGGGAFVAVGGGRTNRSGYQWSQVILSSLDGVRWTAQQVLPGQPALWKVFFASDRFVTAGNFGTFLTSIDGATWTAVKTPFGDRLSGIAYGNGRFVVIGRLGQVLASTDGLVWTTNRVSGLPEFFDVTFGNGKFVVVGDDSSIWSSTDGANWARKDSGVPVTKVNPVAITYGAGQFVAVGSHGSIMTSVDGDQWEVRSTGESANFSQVAAGNGQIVAVGSSAIQVAPRSFQATQPLLSSADGTNWQVPVSQLDFGMFSVSFVNGQFVAFGRRNASPERVVILASTNGTTWQTGDISNTTSLPFRVTNDGRLYVGAGGGFFHSSDGLHWAQDNPIILNSVIALAYGNGRFIAFDGGGKLYTSSTGTNWLSGNIAPGLVDLAFGNGKFVAVGGGYRGGKEPGQILVSTNGQDWTQQMVPAAGDGRTYSINGVAYGGGWFVAVGRGAVTVSKDGINWTAKDPRVMSDLLSVAYDNIGSFVAVGGNGTVVQSGNVLASILTNPISDPNGVSFTLSGPMGQIYLIQSTTDLSLSRWTDLGLVTNVSGRILFTDSARLAQRFYRAASNP